MEFWVKKGKPAIFLAPMEGVTDGPMRALLTELGGYTHCVTEFLRISQLALPVKCYPKHAHELATGSRTAAGVPVIFQLLGGDPERLAESAANAVKAGARAIDLNFGCPAPTVNRNDGGATLLQYPDRIEAIVRAVRDAVPQEFSVSAKLRLGWNDPEAIFENAQRAARGGASWITIHGRTKFQGYTPPAYWEPIGRVRKLLDIPVIANGEIFTLEDFYRCQEQSGCEHFMLGRGALANPLLVKQIAKSLGLQCAEAPKFLNNEEWQCLLVRFLNLCEEVARSDAYALSRLKQWLQYVYRQKPFEQFHSIKRMHTLTEVRAALAQAAIVT